MSKYIDAEKLIAIVEKRNEWLANSGIFEKGKEVALYATGKSFAYAEFISCVNSLQQVKLGVDLEKEIDKFLNESGAPYVWCNDDEQKEWCNIIARHFAEWGAIRAEQGQQAVKWTKVKLLPELFFPAKLGWVKSAKGVYGICIHDGVVSMIGENETVLDDSYFISYNDLMLIKKESE